MRRKIVIDHKNDRHFSHEDDPKQKLGWKFQFFSAEKINISDMLMRERYTI